MTYYLLLDSQVKVPYTITQLRGMWSLGLITVRTQVCDSGSENWQALEVRMELVEPPNPPVIPASNRESNWECVLPAKAKPEKLRISGFAVLILGLAVLVLGGMFDSGESSSSSQGNSGAATLSSAGNDRVPVCVDESTWNEVVSLARGGDVVEKERLVGAGRMFRVPSGTRVATISAGFTLTTIRVMAGEFAGRTGIVPSEWVKH